MRSLLLPGTFNAARMICLVVVGLTSCGINDNLEDLNAPSNVMKVTFFDVDQGDACLFEMPNGAVVLIDGGDDGYGDAVINPALDERKITVIDLLVLTHPHADHCGGLDEVLEHVGVREIWENGETLGTVAYNRFASARDAVGADILHPVEGTFVDMGAVHILVIGAQQEYEGENNDSLVLKISYGDVDFLMTGDIEAEEQLDEVDDYKTALNSEVLKVPHHGSRNLCLDFTTAVCPQCAIFSSGEGNEYGHPHAETLEIYKNLGATLYRTDLLGDISAWTNGSALEVGNF